MMAMEVLDVYNFVRGVNLGGLITGVAYTWGRGLWSEVFIIFCLESSDGYAMRCSL